MNLSQGGRYIEDIEQFWYSVALTIKEYYPVNECPEEIASELKSLVIRAEQFVRDGRAFLLKVPE